MDETSGYASMRRCSPQLSAQRKIRRGPVSIYGLDGAVCHWPVGGAGLATMFCGEARINGGRLP
jgi:hypothetical protein